MKKLETSGTPLFRLRKQGLPVVCRGNARRIRRGALTRLLRGRASH